MNRVTSLALAAAVAVGVASIGCKSDKSMSAQPKPAVSTEAPAGSLRLGAGDQVGASDLEEAKSTPQKWSPAPAAPPASVSAGNDQATAAAAAASTDGVTVTASGQANNAANSARPVDPAPSAAADQSRQTVSGSVAAGNAARGAANTADAVLANAAEAAKSAKAEVVASKAPGMDDVKGTVEFSAVPDGVKVTYDITGLGADSKHGFHIHEKGDLSDPELKSAGGHFNPGGHKHGGPEGDMRHGGDLGNITADAKGEAKGEVMVHGVTLAEGDTGIVGRSVIVHEKADDFATDPSGNSGARIAGGVIKAASNAPAGEKDAGNAKKE